MKFTCQKSELIKALQIISKAISSNPQNPILSGIYIEADENQIELRATDHEIGIITQIPAEIEEQGNVILSGRYFQEIARSLPGETLTLSYDSDKKIANIKSASSNFDLLSMTGEFPPVRMNEKLMTFTIKNNVLNNLIKKTAFASATDDKRPVFTGCLMEINNSEINMVATNTHRLAFQQVVLEGFEGSRRIIIPSKVLQELTRVMSSELPEDIEVSCSDTRISFTFGNIYLISRLIEGQFPDYHRVIPPDFSTRVTLTTADFMAAVDRVSLMARHDDYKIMRFEFSGSQVKISSNNPSIGYAEEYVSAEIDGNDINIAFNFTYLSDALKNIDTEKMYFSLNQSLSPAAIREPLNESFIYIITPVKTKH